MIRGLGRPLIKFRTHAMSRASGQGSKSASSSRVLSAVDACLLAADFQPDGDGVIDLTTAENDALSGAVGAQLMGRRPSGAGL